MTGARITDTGVTLRLLPKDAETDGRDGDAVVLADTTVHRRADGAREVLERLRDAVARTPSSSRDPAAKMHAVAVGLWGTGARAVRVSDDWWMFTPPETRDGAGIVLHVRSKKEIP